MERGVGMDNISKYLLGKSLKAYAELYAEDNNTAVTIPAGGFVQYSIPNSNVGVLKRITLDATTQTATIIKSGVYQIACTYASESDTSNIILDTALYVNEEKVQGAHIQRELRGPTLVSPATLTTTIALTKGDELTLRIKHNSASSVDITTHYASFSMHLI